MRRKEESAQEEKARTWLANQVPALLPHFFGEEEPTNPTLKDMKKSLLRYGHLTDKQVNYAMVLAGKSKKNPPRKESKKNPPRKERSMKDNHFTPIYRKICRVMEANFSRSAVPTKLVVRTIKADEEGPRFGNILGRLHEARALGLIERRGRGKYRWSVASDWKVRIDSDLEPVSPSPSPQQDESKVTELTAQLERQAQELQSKEKMIAELKAQNALQIVIKHPDGKLHKVTDRVHRVFARALQLAAERKSLLLVGPAGCGKSFMCRQLKKALKLPRFGSLNCSVGMSEGHLLGRLLPTGEAGKFEYSRSRFVECYEEGGLFLLDEMDAADPNVLIVLNTALADGVLPVPNRVDDPEARRHPDFVFVAAANTYGKGADRQYVGRNELDEATLDRFRIGLIEMDYEDGLEIDNQPTYRPSIPQSFIDSRSETSLECEVCPNDDLRIRFQWYRQKIREARLERIVSTRFLVDAYAMVSNQGWTITDCEQAFFSGWSSDEIRKVVS